MKNRWVAKQVSGSKTSDGAGVKLTRVIGSSELNMLDPFLLLDCFESDDADDYIAGFPEHPHRGFETVTYLLNGKMRHKDSAGHEGVIESGGVQWMTAGKGILHSEMPEQERGLLQGFQLWVNLPKVAKMTEPKYQEYKAKEIALEQHQNGAEIKVIAGVTNKGTQGPVSNEYVTPIYMDITLPKGSSFEQAIPRSHNAFVYVLTGGIAIQAKENNDIGQSGEFRQEVSSLGENYVAAKMLGILSEGDQLCVISDLVPSRFLLIAGLPLNEPVARGGPFVMNTKTEVMQAFEDYNNGKFSL